MESTATPPWETKKKKAASGRLRRLFLWGGALGLVALVASGLREKPIPVETATITHGPLTVHIVEEGKTRIRNRYIVSAPVSGHMRRISLKAGDEVKAGETLLTVIEPGLSPLLDARAQAQAEARVQTAEASHAKAREALEMARTAAQFAQANWDRVKKNISEGSISVTDKENIERDAQMREREVRAAEFSLQVAEHEITTAKAALLQLTAPAGSPGSSIEVKAPVSGRILKVQQESAMIVAAGTALLEIGDPADLEIEAEILSRDAVGMKPGAEVLVDQWGGDIPLKARVRLVEPAAFTKVSALGVEEQRVIVLSDFDPLPPEARTLGDRYRVEVRVAVWHSDDVPLIPGGALFREGTQWMTFLKKGNHAVKAAVQIGRTDGKMSQILSGLEPGTEVLIHPPDSVVDGSQITAKATSAE